MRSAFDRRVVPEPVIESSFARSRLARPPTSRAARRSAAHTCPHRRSANVDLFSHDAEAVRDLVAALPSIARACAGTSGWSATRGRFVRATATVGGHAVEIDLVHEALPDLEPPPPPLEGVVVESFADLRASKLTCLLSRAEPRDLVDLLFLDRAGYPPEQDLVLALRKDAGIDPGVLAWLLRDFPTRPLPQMIEPLTEAELAAFRDQLGERFRRAAMP